MQGVGSVLRAGLGRDVIRGNGDARIGVDLGDQGNKRIHQIELAPHTTRWRAPCSVCYFDDKGRQAMGIYPEPYEKTCPRDTSRPIRAYAELLLALLQSLYLEPVCVRENVCVCVYVPGTVGSWTTTPPHESGARGRRHTWAMTETDGIYEIKGAILSMVFTPPKTGRAGQNYTSLQRQGQQATRVHR